MRKISEFFGHSQHEAGHALHQENRDVLWSAIECLGALITLIAVKARSPLESTID